MLEGAVMGIFLSLDLIAFFIFWELLLVPMYFLIQGWGSGRREFAAMKFFRESALVAWLGIAMPVGVMIVLVMYTLVDSTDKPGGVGAALIAVAFTVGLHLWKRSATWSILLGTALYVVLVNWVF